MMENFSIEYLMMNIGFITILVFGVYGRKNERDEYAFTYIIYNLVTYILSYYLITMIQLLGADVGAEAFLLGLFALFGMIRYRTTPIPVYKLTFLFVAIGLGLANAVMQTAVEFPEILSINILIILVAFIADFMTNNVEARIVIVSYDNLELVRGDEKALIEDLEIKTGLVIKSVSVTGIDLLRETASLKLNLLE